MPQLTYRVVTAGIVRNQNDVLLVRQKGHNDSVETWALPGGIVEHGEIFSETLIREIREETGLIIEKIGKLAYFTQLDDQAGNVQSLASVFLIDDWRGTLQPADPDSFVKSAAFFPAEEAVHLLASLPWLHMREPAIIHIQNQAPAGAVWLYRQREDGKQQLVARL